MGARTSLSDKYFRDNVPYGVLHHHGGCILLSARNRRSESAFPGGEIFVQRTSVLGPNNGTVAADVDLDLEDDRIIRILATEIFFDEGVVNANSQRLGAAVLNPDLASLTESVADLGNDDILHFFRVDQELVTTGWHSMKETDYRRYMGDGITYGQQRFRFLFFSPQNLSGGIFGGAIYYQFDRVTTERALALLRRR